MSDYICEAMMNFNQYEESLQWFFDKIEASPAHPQPQVRWLGEDAVILQANWPPGIADLPPGELLPNLTSLVKVLEHILNREPC